MDTSFPEKGESLTDKITARINSPPAAVQAVAATPCTSSHLGQAHMQYPGGPCTICPCMGFKGAGQ